MLKMKSVLFFAWMNGSDFISSKAENPMEYKDKTDLEGQDEHHMLRLRTPENV